MVPAPICYDCKYFDFDEEKKTAKFRCKAYPKGVPQDMYEAGTHDKVRKDQVGKFIFEHKKLDK